MRAIVTAFVLGLTTAGFLAGAPQDQDEEKKKQEEEDEALLEDLAPFTAFREKEKKRLEEEIEGSWVLQRFETPSNRFDSTAIQGYAIFYEGFMALTLRGQGRDQTWFDVEQRVLTLQAGVFRYQFGDLLTLQTASIMGFSLPDRLNDPIFERFNQAREYLVDLDEYELRLNHPSGYWFVFTKMERGEFPEETLKELEAMRWNADDIFDTNDREDRRR